VRLIEGFWRWLGAGRPCAIIGQSLSSGSASNSSSRTAVRQQNIATTAVARASPDGYTLPSHHVGER